MSQVALTACAEPLVLNFLKKFFIQSYEDDFFYLCLIFVDVLPFVLSFVSQAQMLHYLPGTVYYKIGPPHVPEVSENHQQTANH